MKIQRALNCSAAAGKSSGSAVIVILAFLAIMVMLVTANTKTVNWLRAEVRLTDQRETARLAASVAPRPAANTTPSTAP